MENTTVPTVIGSITAFDLDANENGIVYYQLSSQFLSLHPFNGELTLIQSLDFEYKTELNFFAIARDGGNPPLSSNVSVLILIIPVNDNPPLFARDVFTFSLNENLMFFQLINATDADVTETDPLQYSLIPPVFPFLVDTRTGLIHTVQPLDYEEQVSYSLTLQVTDGLFISQAQVVISIIDENDNAPTFPEEFSITISETTESGRELLLVFAEDIDSGINGQITYFIDDSLADQYFRVDALNGSVTLRQMFDFEEITSILLKIQAVDGGIPQLTGEITIPVFLTDVDDNPPSVTSRDTVFHFIEEGEELLLGSVMEVIDNDTHPLVEAVVMMNIPNCVLGLEKLQVDCGSNQLCIDQCAESLEVSYHGSLF